jgi:hypothetical protein
MQLILFRVRPETKTLLKWSPQVANGLLIISLTPPPGSEAALEEWAVKNHLPEVMSSRRFVSAGLYKTTDLPTLPGVEVLESSYVTVYEVDAATAEELDDAGDGLREMLARGDTSFPIELLMGSEITSSWVLPVSVMGATN